MNVVYKSGFRYVKFSGYESFNKVCVFIIIFIIHRYIHERIHHIYLMPN